MRLFVYLILIMKIAQYTNKITQFYGAMLNQSLHSSYE